MATPAAYDTLGDVLLLTRQLLDDRTPVVWEDPELIAYVNTAYYRVQRDFNQNDISFMKKRARILGVPAGTLTINRDTTQPVFLPADLLVPFKIWERDSGSDESSWRVMRMVEDADEGLPRPALYSWEWRADAIWFTGALTPRDLDIVYECYVSTLKDLADPLLIPRIGWAVAYVAASIAVSGKISTSPRPDVAMQAVTFFNSMAKEQVDTIINRQVQQRQRMPQRHRAYSGMRG